VCTVTRVGAVVLVEPDDMTMSTSTRPGLLAGAVGGQAATPIAPCRVGRPTPIVGACQECAVVILVRDEELVPGADADGTLACPACAGRLRRWGFARPRWLRTRDGGRRWERPARVRCATASCRRTQVLLPARCVPGRSCDADTVGAALLAAAQGCGHRPVAASLGLPAATVRGWLRAARANADWLYQIAVAKLHDLDYDPAPLQPVGNPLGEAVSALGAAAAAVKRFMGVAMSTPAWPVIVIVSQGRLLRPERVCPG
jgi:hypothetical protein